MRTQPPFYRKIGGLRFFRLGRLQLSFCVCRPIPQEVTATRAERIIDTGLPRIVQRQFGPFPIDTTGEAYSQLARLASQR